MEEMKKDLVIEMLKAKILGDPIGSAQDALVIEKYWNSFIKEVKKSLKEDLVDISVRMEDNHLFDILTECLIKIYENIQSEDIEGLKEGFYVAQTFNKKQKLYLMLKLEDVDDKDVPK